MGVSLAVWGDKFKAYPQVQTAGYLLLGLAAALALIFFILWWRTEQIADLMDRLLRARSERVRTGSAARCAPLAGDCRRFAT